MLMNFDVVPDSRAGAFRNGTLTNVTYEDIVTALGFTPNVDDDKTKVAYSWGFRCRGKLCSIWSYYNSHRDLTWSTYGDPEVFEHLFPSKYQS